MAKITGFGKMVPNYPRVYHLSEYRGSLTTKQMIKQVDQYTNQYMQSSLAATVYDLAVENSLPEGALRQCELVGMRNTTLGISNTNIQYCAESMWSAAKDALSKVWEMITNILHKFGSWFENYLDDFDAIKKKLDATAARANMYLNKPAPSFSFTINTGAKYLAVPSVSSAEIQYITNQTQLRHTIDNLDKAITRVLEVQKSGSEDIARFTSVVSNLNLSNDDAIKKSYNAITSDTETSFKVLVDSAANLPVAVGYNANHATAYTANVLPGYERLIILIGEMKVSAEQSDKVLEMAELINVLADKYNGFDCKIVDGDPTGKTAPKEEVRFDAMAASGIIEQINIIKKNIEEIIRYRSSGVFRKNEISFKALENATTKINATYVTGTNTATSAYSKALIKTTVAKAKAVARLFHAPAKLLTLYSTFINFYIDLCNKSLEAYNK